MSTILSLRVASFLFILFLFFSFSTLLFQGLILLFFRAITTCYFLSCGYCVLPPTSPCFSPSCLSWKFFTDPQSSSTCKTWSCLVKWLETGLIIHSVKKVLQAPNAMNGLFIYAESCHHVLFRYEYVNRTEPLLWSRFRTHGRS